MVDLLVLIFIFAVDGMRKSFIAMCKLSWLFCKIVVICGFVPLFDAAMLALALVKFLSVLNCELIIKDPSTGEEYTITE